MNHTSVNWIAAYNRLFLLFDKKDTPTYYSGPNFLRMAQQVEPDIPEPRATDFSFTKAREKYG